MKYIVRCVIPFGIDDTYDCEYSGTEHETKEAAEKEAAKAAADKDNGVIYAYIDELED